jgi:hypothetical protein
MHHIVVAIIVAVILSFVLLLLRVASEDRYDRINYIVGYDYYLGERRRGCEPLRDERSDRALTARPLSLALAIIDIYLLS